jgi:cell division protein FtsZ
MENGLNFTMQETEGPRKVRIKVIGAGGAGGNAVNRMIDAGVTGVEFIAVNTDYQDLEKSRAPVKIPIGQKLTRGLGTGGNPDRGEEAANEDAGVLAEHIHGADLVFIAAGMGGGTGTGSAPVLARLAAEAGALVVAVVTKPFSMEGRERESNARRGLDQLAAATATLIVIPNDNLLQHLPKGVKLREAFKAADDILRQGVQGITDLITKPGDVNRDFEDARTVLSSGGRAVMGMGIAKGEGRAVKAAEAAAHKPLLEDASIQGAHSILINITADESLSLDEVSEITEFVRAKASPESNVLWGTSMDSDLGEELRVTVVAASFDNPSDMAAIKGLKRPAFGASTASGAGASQAGTAHLGNVPGVDQDLPATGSTGFIRGARIKGEPAQDAVMAAEEKNYEVMQTPAYIRRHRS